MVQLPNHLVIFQTKVSIKLLGMRKDKGSLTEGCGVAGVAAGATSAMA